MQISVDVRSEIWQQYLKDKVFKGSLKLPSVFIFYVSTISKSKRWLSYFCLNFNEEIHKLFKQLFQIKVCTWKSSGFHNKCIWTLAKLFCYKQRKVDVLHEFIINFRTVPPAAQSANNVITIHVKSKLQHTLWHWKWLLIVSLKCCFNCNIIIGIFLLTISNL